MSRPPGFVAGHNKSLLQSISVLKVTLFLWRRRRRCICTRPVSGRRKVLGSKPGSSTVSAGPAAGARDKKLGWRGIGFECSDSGGFSPAASVSSFVPPAETLPVCQQGQWGDAATHWVWNPGGYISVVLRLITPVISLWTNVIYAVSHTTNYDIIVRLYYLPF